MVHLFELSRVQGYSNGDPLETLALGQHFLGISTLHRSQPILFIWKACHALDFERWEYIICIHPGRANSISNRELLYMIPFLFFFSHVVLLNNFSFLIIHSPIDPCKILPGTNSEDARKDVRTVQI
jgi:hypothetical protein